MAIRRLPPLVVNQIAAGEVIERPASVVKELVENALDAGATRIDVEIEDGGRELIRVTDNGCGIDAAELPLALAAHATSKIQTTADLDAIATLGFRGEALASIASVSRLALTSRPANSEGAAVIEAEGDSVSEPRPAPGPLGTTVTVRNLFFNTPARRKFLRTEQTEAGRVADVIQSLALSHPAVGFTLKSNGRVTLELPPGHDPRRRVLAVLGPELEAELLEARADERGLSLWGLAGRPEIARASSRFQRIYLNGRPISDRSVTHAIKEAYRGLIEPARHPTIVLFITMDAAHVDVNVHPAKSEVRFRNQGAVHGAVLAALRRALRAADLTPNFDLGRAQAPWAPALQPAPPFGTGLAGDSSHAGAVSSSAAAFVDYFRRLDPAQKGFVYSEVKQALAPDLPAIDPVDGNHASTPAEPDDEADLPTVRQPIDILQVHSSYLVTQDEQGLLIIDQHALHERVMFEKLKREITQGSLESQRLLMPVVLEVDRAHVELLEELQPILRRIGVEAERFGPTAIAVHAFSSFLFNRGVEPQPFLRGLFEKALEHGLPGDAEAALHEALDMMACKAAVKAGDRLAPEELAELLKYRDLIERSSNCPHGRPTTLRLSIRDLEKQFGRT